MRTLSKNYYFWAYFIVFMNPIIRITREFSFEMAHVLGNYDGPCKNIHGHSYKLFVTLTGTQVDDVNDPKYGMVIDFAELKKIVRKEIICIFDHSLVVSSSYLKEKADLMKSAFENVRVVDFQPTCENLVLDFVARLKGKFPPGISLFSIRLYETANLYAEWFASDNNQQ